MTTLRRCAAWSLVVILLASIVVSCLGTVFFGLVVSMSSTPAGADQFIAVAAYIGFFTLTLALFDVLPRARRLAARAQAR